MIKIRVFPLGAIYTNSYLLMPENSDKAVLVDAPEGAAETITKALKAEKRTLAAVLLTHCHWDHTMDAAQLKTLTNAAIVGGRDGAQLLEEEGFQETHMSLKVPCVKMDVYPKDGQILDFAGMKIKCLSTAGHCPGSITYYIDDGDAKYAFTGDALFNGDIGRTDLWGGDIAELENAIRTKIYALPPETYVLPGHGPSSTVGEERKSNACVRA